MNRRIEDLIIITFIKAFLKWPIYKFLNDKLLKKLRAPTKEKGGRKDIKKTSKDHCLECDKYEKIKNSHVIPEYLIKRYLGDNVFYYQNSNKNFQEAFNSLINERNKVFSIINKKYASSFRKICCESSDDYESLRKIDKNSSFNNQDIYQIFKKVLLWNIEKHEIAFGEDIHIENSFAYKAFNSITQQQTFLTYDKTFIGEGLNLGFFNLVGKAENQIEATVGFPVKDGVRVIKISNNKETYEEDLITMIAQIFLESFSYICFPIDSSLDNNNKIKESILCVEFYKRKKEKSLENILQELRRILSINKTINNLKGE